MTDLKRFIIGVSFVIIIRLRKINLVLFLDRWNTRLREGKNLRERLEIQQQKTNKGLRRSGSKQK